MLIDNLRVDAFVVSSTKPQRIVRNQFITRSLGLSNPFPPSRLIHSQRDVTLVSILSNFASNSSAAAFREALSSKTMTDDG